jgi:hypothetical protein
MCVDEESRSGPLSRATVQNAGWNGSIEISLQTRRHPVNHASIDLLSAKIKRRRSALRKLKHCLDSIITANRLADGDQRMERLSSRNFLFRARRIPALRKLKNGGL